MTPVQRILIRRKYIAKEHEIHHHEAEKVYYCFNFFFGF